MNSGVVHKVYKKGKFSNIAKKYLNNEQVSITEKIKEQKNEQKNDIPIQTEPINTKTENTKNNNIIQAYIETYSNSPQETTIPLKTEQNNALVNEQILTERLRLLEYKLTRNSSLHSGGGSNAKNYANGGVMNGNLIINGNLTVNGNITDQTQVSTITSNYQVTSTDEVLLVDCTNGNIQITLTDVGDFDSKLYIKRIDGTTNNLTVSGSQQIDNLDLFNISRQYTAITLINDNNKWWII